MLSDRSRTDDAEVKVQEEKVLWGKHTKLSSLSAYLKFRVLLREKVLWGAVQSSEGRAHIVLGELNFVCPPLCILYPHRAVPEARRTSRLSRLGLCVFVCFEIKAHTKTTEQ